MRLGESQVCFSASGWGPGPHVRALTQANLTFLLQHRSLPTTERVEKAGYAPMFIIPYIAHKSHLT